MAGDRRAGTGDPGRDLPDRRQCRQESRRGGVPAAVPASLQPYQLDRGGSGGDLMELNGWSSPQMLGWYGGSARGARTRRSYDRIMSS
jgi:hypothetical protein